MLLAALFVGCSKDNEEPTAPATKRINIFAGAMGGNGSKVWMNPANVNASSVWVPTEQIELNGTPYEIQSEGSRYYLDVDPAPEGTLYAIYPASVNANGNHIDVSYDGTTASAVAIHSLAVTFRTVNEVLGHDVYFPMAATAANGNEGLYFDHLTGGVTITLDNNRGSALNVAKLVVTALNASDQGAIYKDLKPSWAGGMFPALPEGEVGEITGDQSTEFVSSMTLFLRDADHSTEYKTIAANGNTGETLTFCMPLIAKQVKYLQITAYASDGSQIFQTNKVDLGPADGYDIEVNTLYNLNPIPIN